MITRRQLWTGLLRDLFPEMVKFFYSKESARLNLSKIKYLDSIFQSLMTASESNESGVFRMAQIPGEDGKPNWFLFHIHLHHLPDEDLQNRLFKLFYKILDQYGVAVEIMVVLADTDPDFHPRRYHSKVFLSQTSLDFGTYKLADQSVRRLSSLQNPISILMLIALEAIRQKEIKDEVLLKIKLKLFRKILSNGYDITTTAKLAVFLTYYSPFKDQTTRESFDQQVSAISYSLDPDFEKRWQEEENRYLSLGCHKAR